MRLTTYTDYALRVLMRLALQLKRPTTIADIAKDYEISENQRRMEPDVRLVPCFEAANTCVLTPACELRDVLGDARDVFLAVLDDCTFADLARLRRRLSALFCPKERRPS
ncbi:MAG: Rrf2 family transcriptional regulator [Proteobacteria bacterium]|nr:Rrf2 family transcriptional regulator [Pseudomonadota bacterium]